MNATPLPGTPVRRSRLLAPLLASFVLFFARRAPALTHTGQLDQITYSVYAPDWTWQNRDVNILVVLDNPGPQTRDITVTIGLPKGKTDHFTYEGPADFRVTVPPGGTTRAAFTDIHAEAGVARQTYDLQLTVETDGRSAVVAYPLQTIRGEAFSGGRRVALFVPAGVALVWCIAFAVALTKMARPGAWKTPAVPLDEPSLKEPWIDQQPT
jgi:hypothetical protein